MRAAVRQESNLNGPLVAMPTLDQEIDQHDMKKQLHRNYLSLKARIRPEDVLCMLVTVPWSLLN